MRILKEVLLLLSLYAGVALGVFGVWRLWPESKAHKGGSQEDASLLDRAEGKVRDLLHREVTADANDEAVVKEGLRKVQERLAPALGKLSFPLESYIIDSGTVNAVCLPGNIILVYSGLLRRLQSPEELAAILAHEIAHAVHRDPMQALKRELGLAALFAMVGGRGDGVTGRLMHRLVSSGFSRQQELAADEEALRVLAASDIDPKALGDALRRIRGDKADDPGVLQYISTHPGFDERVQLSEKASADWPGKERPIDLDWKQFRAQFRVIR